MFEHSGLILAEMEDKAVSSVFVPTNAAEACLVLILLAANASGKKNNIIFDMKKDSLTAPFLCN